MVLNYIIQQLTMIKPKHSFGKKSFEVKEEFIDREGAKKLYHDKLNCNRKEYNIVVYYGVGGVGKSKLRREICRMHKEENQDGLMFKLDLNNPEDRSLGKGILKLVDSCNKKIEFKSFELAYAVYYSKKNPIEQYGREKTSVTDCSLINTGLSLLGFFDSGITGFAIQTGERVLNAISKCSIDKDVKEELKNFKDCPIQEMEERLPLFFQYDLKKYIEKHPQSKVLMVFDTFEALNENVIEKIHRSKNERWVQELIAYFDTENFPSLLFAIFGRDKLEWDEEWQSMLEQHELVGFEDQYSREYFTKAGVTDSEIVDTIINSSKGYPFLLYLSLETYANIKNSGREPRVEDFNGSYPEIIERFIYNLDKDTVEVLRLMSVPNFYNADIFKILISEFNISFPMTEYEQFNKYSFVASDEQQEGDFYIHKIMRHEMLEKSSVDTVRIANKTLLKYYADKIGININTKDVLELFYHARMSMNEDEFNRWLVTPINCNVIMTPLIWMHEQQKSGEQNLLMQIINGIKASYKVEQLLIEFANIYIDIVHLGGDYLNAVAICDDYLSQYTLEQISQNEQLIEMRIRKIHHSMFFMPVNELIAEAKMILPYIDERKYPKQYNEMLFLLGGNLGVLSGNFEECLVWLNKSMQHAKDNNLYAFIHRTIRKQADILLAHDDIKGALSLLTPVVSPTVELNDIDSRYKIYLMGVLGEVYRKQGNLDIAWHCYDIVEKKSIENCLRGWQAHAYLAKGMVELQKDNYVDANCFFDKALTIYNDIQQKWGIINTMQARLLLDKKQGTLILVEAIERVTAEALFMGYQYNVEYSKKVLDEAHPYLQLFFL